MQSIELELWHVISLLLMFLGASAGVGKLLLSTHLKHFDERFDALDKQAQQWQDLEHELMSLKADLPTNYVMREDYIRGQSTIEAKLDALRLQLQNVELKTAVQGGKLNG